ncbi:hypothetical protein HPSA20_1281 [Helicobacter pylori SouthAfrica20]|uniref:Uncharacterized protein n=1 Tax=Helicobacter pylori SouthAfrica20 TaxID=1352356 RepID=T1UB40_HELPX|nr:hypothetical protein HPSA20_1281 [Helicobacter pylori SouthAfrica20]
MKNTKKRFLNTKDFVAHQMKFLVGSLWVRRIFKGHYRKNTPPHPLRKRVSP